MSKVRYELDSNGKVIDKLLDEYVEDVVDRLNEQHENKLELLREKQILDKDNIELRNQLDRAYERLKGVSVLKFELGQEVFVFDGDKQIRSGRIFEIQINGVLHDRQPHITYLVDFTGNYSDDDQENDYYEEKDIYATEEEINIKLQELRGGE